MQNILEEAAAVGSGMARAICSQRAIRDTFFTRENMKVRSTLFTQRNPARKLFLSRV
jgi:hypothetical protein